MSVSDWKQIQPSENLLEEFHQTLVDDEAEVEVVEVIRFWRSTGQGEGRYKVRYEKIGTLYLLNGLKYHNQISACNRVWWKNDIFSSRMS